MLALGLFISNILEQVYLSNLEDRLTDGAMLIGQQMMSEPILWTDPNKLDTLAIEWAEILGARLTLIGSDGTVLGESHEDRITMENHLDRPEVVQAQTDGIGISKRFSTTIGFNMMYTAYAVKVGEEIQGYVRLAVPLTAVEETIGRLRWTIVGAAMIVSGLAAALSIVIAKGVVRPLSELTEVAQRLAVDESLWRENQRIPTTSHDEIGLLTQAFNAMTTQLGSKIEALTAESVKLNAVLQQMTDGVLIVDHDGFVQLINPAAERLFVTTMINVIKRPFVEVVRHHQLVDLYRSCRETKDLQMIVLDLPISRLYIQGIAIPLGEALPGSILLVFQDLTRMRHLEIVRRDFISNISHELRTPLASLKAVTETLLDGALDDPVVARKFLLNMEKEVDLMSVTVSELLELSRIESGKVPLAIIEVSPRNLLDGALSRLELQAGRAGLQVSLKCAEDLPNVLADPPRIEQVLVNLLHNAIKFTPEGGEIELGAELTPMGEAVSMMQFSVQDTGVGIAEDDLPRIFERFYKADRSRTGGGTGLGLAIAKHIVEAHSGRIWAVSREGSGSTFFFTIPIALNY